MFQSHLCRIEFQLFGDLVQLNFEGEARLRRSVSTLRATWRLVGESAQAAKLVARDVVGDGLQRARVEGRSHAVRAVSAAVEKRLKVHRRDRAVFFDAGLDLHQHRMASAMTVEN